jgi:hypothetical protein
VDCTKLKWLEETRMCVWTGLHGLRTLLMLLNHRTGMECLFKWWILRVQRKNCTVVVASGRSHVRSLSSYLVSGWLYKAVHWQPDDVKSGISICCVLRATDRSVERDLVNRRMSCTRAALYSGDSITASKLSKWQYFPNFMVTDLPHSPLSILSFTVRSAHWMLQTVQQCALWNLSVFICSVAR